ncbi:MAG TPA: hypothetical protein VF813_03740, partial [Anaerolineaceae bacterium]
MSKNGTIRTFDAILFDLGSTLLYFNGVWPEVIAESHQELVCDLVARGYRIDENRFAADILA